MCVCVCAGGLAFPLGRHTLAALPLPRAREGRCCLTACAPRLHGLACRRPLRGSSSSAASADNWLSLVAQTARSSLLLNNERCRPEIDRAIEVMFVVADSLSASPKKTSAMIAPTSGTAAKAEAMRRSPRDRLATMAKMAMTPLIARRMVQRGAQQQTRRRHKSLEAKVA